VGSTSIELNQDDGTKGKGKKDPKRRRKKKERKRRRYDERVPSISAECRSRYTARRVARREAQADMCDPTSVSNSAENEAR
jgi:hypothetical protein